MVDVYNKVVKFKKLQKFGTGLVIHLPKSWLEALKWDRNSEIAVELRAYAGKIVLVKHKQGEMENEEISDPIQL